MKINLNFSKRFFNFSSEFPKLLVIDSVRKAADFWSKIIKNPIELDINVLLKKVGTYPPKTALADSTCTFDPQHPPTVKNASIKLNPSKISLDVLYLMVDIFMHEICHCLGFKHMYVKSIIENAKGINPMHLTCNFDHLSEEELKKGLMSPHMDEKSNIHPTTVDILKHLGYALDELEIEHYNTYILNRFRKYSFNVKNAVNIDSNMRSVIQDNFEKVSNKTIYERLFKHENPKALSKLEFQSYLIDEAWKKFDSKYNVDIMDYITDKK